MPDPQITVPPQPAVTVTAPPDAPMATQTPPVSDQIQPQDAPTPPAPSAQQANIAHSAMVGHGFKALLSSMGGTTTQYQQTPEGPVPVQVKNSGGDFFRHILAGAILGGAAGAEHNDGSGAGWGGAARGAMAVHQNDQQQQQLRQQEAQREFVNKQAADKARQEATGFDTEQQVRKAQIAQANAETLKTVLLTQGSSYDMHARVAKDASERLSSLTDAGVEKVFEGVPESQMNDIIANRAGGSTLKWEPTGVTTVTTKDANGNDVPNYEYTFSAYDPNKSIPLSKGTVDQWEKDGLFKYHPEYKDMATPGKTLSVGQLTSLDRMARNYYGQNLAQTKGDLETQHIQAQIDEAHSAINEHNTQTKLANLSIQEKQTALAEKNAVNIAWAHLAAVGNDPDQLKDSHDKIALAKAAQPALAENLQTIKDAQANLQDKDAQDSLPALWARHNALLKLASLASPVGSATPIPYTDPTQPGKQFNIPPDQEQAFLKAHPQAAKVGATADPLASVTKGSTLLKRDDGVTLSLPDDSLQNFLSLHPEYKPVGKGKAERPKEESDNFLAPNGSTVLR